MDKQNLIKKSDKFKDKVIGSIKWDTNDADYEYKLIKMNACEFFNNDQLLKVLAFVSTPSTFKGAKYGTIAFGNYIGDYSHHYNYNGEFENEYEKIHQILEDNNLLIYTDDGYAHSVESVELFYFDVNNSFHSIDFSPIRDGWESMTYEEIIESIVK